MKILHLSTQFARRYDGGGVTVARDSYISLSEQLGHLAVRIDFPADEAVDEAEVWNAVQRSGAELVQLHHIEHQLSPSLLARVVDAFPTLSTAYDVSGLCLTNRKVLPSGDFCDEPLGSQCLEYRCPSVPAWADSELTLHDPQNRLAKRIEHLAVLRAATVLVHSRYMKRQYRLNGFCDGNLVEVLPPLRFRLADRVPRPPRQRIVLYAGRLDRNKGVHLLPAVLARLPDKWCMELVGAGCESDSLRQAFYRCGAGERVRFLGFQDDSSLVNRYDRATVLVVPSLVPESFCQVGIEALARGLPVVATSAGAIVDWMQPGLTGEVVPPGDPSALAAAIQRFEDVNYLTECRRSSLACARRLYAEDPVPRQLNTAYEQTVANWQPNRSHVPHPRNGSAQTSAPQPVEWLERGAGGRVLVIAPHYDDEVLGCGGAICLHRQAGDYVRVLHLTDGSLGGPRGSDPQRTSRLRRRESVQALDRLGVVELDGWELPDSSLARRTELTNRLRSAIRAEAPSVVYAPHTNEWHTDHSATGEAAIAATRDMTDCQLRLYEVWTPLARVDVAMDISTVAERKRQAVQEFHSQLSGFDYENTIMALNRFRGRTLGEREYAEAFQVSPATSSATTPAVPLRRIRTPLGTRFGERVVVISESPNGPTGFGQLVRNVVVPLGRQFDWDLTVIVPHLWPGDLNENLKVYPLDDHQQLGEVLEKMPFDLLVQMKDVYGNAGVADCVRRLRDQGRSFCSVVYTPIEGELCHRHLDAIRVFEHVVLYNHYSQKMLGRYDANLAERCHIIPHGVDTIAFFPFSEPRRQAARRELLPHHVFSENRFTLLNINRNYQRKDLPRSLLVLREVLKQVPDVYLHLHTNPYEGDYELVEIARWLGISARNLGFSCQQFGRDSDPLGPKPASSAEIVRLYNAADLVISTSVGEGHGFSTTEAMSCGVPMIGPDNTAFRELLADNRGFLVSCCEDVDSLMFHACAEPVPRAPVSVSAMAEMIARVVRGEVNREACATAALEYVRHWNWDNVRRLWGNLFSQLPVVRKRS